MAQAGFESVAQLIGDADQGLQMNMKLISIGNEALWNLIIPAISPRTQTYFGKTAAALPCLLTGWAN